MLRSALGKESSLALLAGAPHLRGDVQLGWRERVGCLLPCSSRPVVDVVTLMSFSPAEIPVHEVECSYSTSNKMKEGVNITICFQIKSLIPQFQGQSSPPAPRAAAAPNPGLWPGIPHHSTLAFSALPRPPGCQSHLHSAAGWPPDQKTGVVPRRET